MEKHGFCMALATYPTKEEAQHSIDAVLDLRLASCAQTLDIHSQYIWKAERCRKDEVLVLFKTRWALYDALEQCIRRTHSYEVPEIIALDIEKALTAYTQWIGDVTC